jgi:ribosomal protein L12E/L44/L45/RPP1/RPP2
MSDTKAAFDFSQFVPGFDFLKSLTNPATGGGGGAVPGMPSLSSWVAPTLSVEEVDKRIQELKTVQYWLEQNGHALKATIQALEVQKMTLSTLRGMNVRMEDLANAFTRAAPTPAATPPVARPAPSPAPAPQMEATDEPEEDEEDEDDEAPTEAATKADARPAGKKGAATKADGAAGVIDPLQWWGALTEQFQHIASSALQEATKLGAPPGSPKKGAADKAEAPAATAAKRKPARKAAAKKRPASRR